MRSPEQVLVGECLTVWSCSCRRKLPVHVHCGSAVGGGGEMVEA